MKGRIHRTDDYGWVVLFDDEFLQLHPDNVNEILELKGIFDNIDARILADPEVEFEIVENHKMSGVVKYAKLKKRG